MYGLLILLSCEVLQPKIDNQTDAALLLQKFLRHN